jgi:hypothetical protein
MLTTSLRGRWMQKRAQNGPAIGRARDLDRSDAGERVLVDGCIALCYKQGCGKGPVGY